MNHLYLSHFVTYNIGLYIYIYLFMMFMLVMFILFLSSSTVMFFLHCMLNILRYEMIPFTLLCSIFLLSRKLWFLWYSCLLLIAESIRLDTSGKSKVGSFLKIASFSWSKLSISLDSSWRGDDEFSWNNIHFIVAKEFLYSKKY